MGWVTFFLLLLWFSLCDSSSVIMMYVSVSLFEFILVGVIWVSWICMCIALIRFGSWQASLLQMGCQPLSPSYHSGTPTMCICSIWWSPISPLGASLFFILYCSPLDGFTCLSSTVLIVTSLCLQVKPTRELLSSVFIFFRFRISVWLFFILSTSPLLFLFYICIVFLISYFCLCSPLVHWASSRQLF